MQREPIISFHGLTPAPALEELVRRRIAALDQFHHNLIGCRVVVAASGHRHHSAAGVDVRIHLELPGPNIDLAREVRHGHRGADAVVAVNAAFSALEDRLKEASRQMGGQEVKHHGDLLHGVVVELEPELGWGYLRGDDGREVYFQKEALPADDWSRLAKGARLRFREMEGDKGPYAVNLALVEAAG